jgi:hypothetical protein
MHFIPPQIENVLQKTKRTRKAKPVIVWNTYYKELVMSSDSRTLRIIQGEINYVF